MYERAARFGARFQVAGLVMKKMAFVAAGTLALALVVSSLLVPVSAEKKPVIPEALVNFVVLKDDNGKPIHNAGVVLHPVNDKGKQERGGLELKTDVDGKASFDGVPYGKLRIQVLAHGFQTFGQDYDVNQPTLEIMVRIIRRITRMPRQMATSRSQMATSRSKRSWGPLLFLL